MEEFKKPCLPNNVLKAESEETLNHSKEFVEKINENINATKSENPYKVPHWSERPGDTKVYNFEVLKSGQIIARFNQLQKKAYWSFGRLPENDIEMAHPTISRFHAVLQYRPMGKKTQNLNEVKVGQQNESEQNSDNNFGEVTPPEGWYIYDLGSTHGTFLNKQRIPPKVYIRIRVGHLLRLGASTRSYILQGPPEDEEPESKLSVTELKAKRLQELEEEALEKKRLSEEAAERARNEDCSWGMTEDADEETDLTHNPYACTNNEELFLDDPKKTLRGYFEREGLELVYKCDEMSAGSFVCRVELPIDDTNGRSIVAEVVHKGRKKECVIQCALEACRILDRHGVLRQANQEPLKRIRKPQNSDSDDDEFWDRTGDVARKKQRKVASNTSATLTYEDLINQENDIDEQIKQIECKLTDYHAEQQRIKTQKVDEGEDLDTYMENLQNKEIKFDKTEIRKLRMEQQRLQTEKQKVQKLKKIAKPLDITLGKQSMNKEELQRQRESTIKKHLPMVGKRNQFSKFKILKVETTNQTKLTKLIESDQDEMEEDEHPKTHESQENTETISKKDETTANQTENNYSPNMENLSRVTASENEKCIETGSSNKKRRHRVRQRSKREQIDINEAEYESSEKYAKWIPPENQNGDGFTELNDKFGY